MAAAESGREPAPRLRAEILGISTTSICGVRDHATLLAHGLERERVSCSTRWLDRGEAAGEAAGDGGRTDIRAWTAALPGALAQDRADVALLHYSVFPFSHRGVPVYVRPILSAVRGSRTPLVTLLHEFAYPWGRDGLRGAIWGITQRACLIDVMRASAAVILTTDARLEWIDSCRWLPRRPAVVAPVFSNLPPAAPVQLDPRAAPVLGLFGYGYGAATVAVILEALRRLREDGLAVSLRLLGAPGPASPEGELWTREAARRGLAHAVTLSGKLPAQELADALAACAVLIFADPSGPSARKTTLAASLASGRPVVALDGAQRWSELARARALAIVAPDPAALTGALERLLRDEHERTALGARGRDFAEQRMSVTSSARVIAELLARVVAAGAR